MARTINASVITELAKDDFNMVSLFYFGFPSPLYLTDAPFTVTDGTVSPNNVFTATPHILSVGSVTETNTPRIGTLTITLSAIEQTYVSLFLNNDYIDIRAEYWRAVLDDNWQVIGSPLLMFDGRISGWDGSESGGKSTISIHCASHWANFATVAGRKTNQNSQQLHFSADTGMQYASHTVKDIRWGRR